MQLFIYFFATIGFFVVIYSIVYTIYNTCKYKGNNQKTNKEQQKIEFKKKIHWTDPNTLGYKVIDSNSLYTNITNFCNTNNIEVIKLNISESDFGYSYLSIKKDKDNKNKIIDFLILELGEEIEIKFD